MSHWGKCEWCTDKCHVFDCDEYGMLCSDCVTWLFKFKDEKQPDGYVEAPIHRVIEVDITWPVLP